MKPLTSKPFTPDLIEDNKRFWLRSSKQDLTRPFNVDDHEALLAICEHHRPVALMIKTTLPTMDGWCTIEKGAALAGLTLAMKPKTIVEIGTYAGRSFLPFLWALQTNNDGGKAIGIDPYDARISSEEEYPGNREWWASVDHAMIQAKFHGFLQRFQLLPWATLVMKKSDDYDPPSQIDILHIDGGHTDVAIRDAERYGSKVRLGGIIVLDDIMWMGGSVLRAIDTLEQMGFRECYRREEENWNVMQKCK